MPWQNRPESPPEVISPADSFVPPVTNASAVTTASQRTTSIRGYGLTVLIVHAKWNAEIVSELVRGTVDELQREGVTVLVEEVPGSWELPCGVNMHLVAMEASPESHHYDAVIAIGVLIKGETDHYHHIAASVSSSLQTISVTHNRPVIFGLLTCLTKGQAMMRAGIPVDGKQGHNHGVDWARAAVDCALMQGRLQAKSL